MGSEKPNFLSQPVVKNVFMFRNGDPYYDARRIVINQKRVSNFETLLREVTGGVQAPFGAVRNIYTPRGGHKVDCLESLQSGEQYVAAGRERFKKLDYIHIGSRKRRLLQTLPMQAKPLPPTRIVVSARFLKPIKEPCTIFVVANGDVLNPAVRLLIHQRLLGQFERILEMITEKMGLKVLGGVRSLFTYEGHQVADGSQLESGQLYVAVGRDRFKKLPYSDLLFPKPRGARRVNGVKAYSLPPIYRFSKQNGNGKLLFTHPEVHEATADFSHSKSIVRCSDSGDGDSKASPPGHNGKDHLSSIVREISQARLMSLRKKRSGQSMTLTVSDNDDQESKADDGNTDDKPLERPAEEVKAVQKPADDDLKAAEENNEKSGEQKPPDEDAKSADEGGEKSEEQEEAAAEETKEEEEKEAEAEVKDEEVASASKADQENQEPNGGKEGDEEKKGDEELSEKEGEATAEPEQKEDEVKEEAGEEVMDESEEEVKAEEQGSSGSNSDKSQDSAEKDDGSHASSEGEKDEQGENVEEEKRDKVGEKGEKNSEEENNDVDAEEEQKETESDSDPGKTQSDNETKDADNDKSSSGNSNQEEDVSETKEGATEESGEEATKENGEVEVAEDDEVESEAELDSEDKSKDTAANGKTGEGDEEKGEEESKGGGSEKKEKM